MIARRNASPLQQVTWQNAPLLPVVAALGVAVSLLDWVSVGALVPLVAIMLSGPAEDTQALSGPVGLVFRLAQAIPPERQAMVLGGLVLALLVLRAMVQAANTVLIAFIQSRFIRDLQNAVARRLTRVEYAFFLREDSARLIQIFNTFTWSVGDALRAWLMLIPAVIGLSVIVALLAWLDWRMALLVLACGGAIHLLLLGLQQWQHRLDEACTQHVLAQGSLMISLVTALRMIRLFGQQRREEARFAAVSQQVFRTGLAWHAVGALIMPGVSAAMAAVFVLVLMLAWHLSVPGPELIAFIVLLARVEPYATVIGQARSGIRGVGGKVREVEWLLSQIPQDEEADGAGNPCPPMKQPIRFDAVSFAYPNGAVALDRASFTIMPGAATALIGPSGSGKTTIVNLLCRLVEPASGRILLGETPAASINPAQWRGRIAVAGQDVSLINGTVAENIAYGRPDASIGEIEEVAAIAGASRFIAGLPGGYDARVGYEGSSLSGGQRQRIGLARALLRRPDLLILDEATNAVDALSEAEIIRLLADHRHFRTALVISHRPATLAACRNGVVLEGGRVIETGPLAGLAYFQAMQGENA